MPEADILCIVAADEQVQQTVTSVVEPDRGVGVDPGRKSCLFRYPGETVALVVVVQLWTSPLNQEQVLVAVVVVVTPNRTRGNSGAGLIDVGNAHLTSHIFESAIVHIAIQGILAAFPTVHNVDI